MTTKGLAVEVQGVTRRFGSTAAVDDLSFDIRPGEVLGLLGPNGAGKTTTMRLITAFLRPTSGRILFDGADLTGDELARKRLVGYVPETSALYPEMTVSAYLRHWAVLRRLPHRARRGAVDRVVRQCGLEPVVRRPIGSLSHGYRQRVSIAQALVHEPPVLLLDEPTSGLDPRQLAATRSLIARLGRRHTVLFSSHRLAEVAQLCRRVVIIDRGHLVTVDDVATITDSRRTLEEAYLRLVKR